MWADGLRGWAQCATRADGARRLAGILCVCARAQALHVRVRACVRVCACA
jgi:hypothetical protein